jgi:16S rRNA (guanine527-N7)-methyltransferase
VNRPPLPLPEAAPLAVPEGFSAGLVTLGVTLPEGAEARIADFLGRMLAMNEQMNLTAVVEPEAAWTRHALDALSLVPLLDLRAGGHVLDLGSGGGVPGVILAIARPDLRFTLVEATGKKAAWLEAVSAALGLTNVTVRNERAEKLVGIDADVVTARAVARLVELVPWAVPLVRPRGHLLLIKGERAEAELDEAVHAMRKHRCVLLRTVPTATGRVLVMRRTS